MEYHAIFTLRLVVGLDSWLRMKATYIANMGLVPPTCYPSSLRSESGDLKWSVAREMRPSRKFKHALPSILIDWTFA